MSIHIETAPPSTEVSLARNGDLVWAAKIAESRWGSVEDVRRITPAGECRLCIAVHPVESNTFG
jgi:hypothetical protein